MTACEREDHHCSGHELAYLPAPSGRDRLMLHVWGRPDKPTDKNHSRLAEAAVGSFVAAAIAMVLTFLGAPKAGGVGLFLLVLGLVFLTIEESIESKKQPLRYQQRTPLSASGPTARLGGGSAVAGIVDVDRLLPAPLSQSMCAAFSITLYTSATDDDSIALRDSATVGFTVVTQEGDYVHIPPGPIELVDHRAHAHLSQEDVDRYLDGFDRLRRGMTQIPDPFTHQRAVETVIQVGDHVALYNPIVRTGFVHGGATGYRDAPRSQFTVQGTPYIELLDLHE